MLNRLYYVLILSLPFFFNSYALVYAQAPTVTGTNPPPTVTGTNPPSISVDFPNPFKGGTSLFGFLRTIINDILLPIGGVIVVLAFIYSGFLYVTAQGNQSKLEKAHLALLYTAIGAAVLLGAWVLSVAICNTVSQLGNSPFTCPT